MKTTKEEYLGILCKLYLIVLLAILPLYMQDGYYMLGDGKYLLFRNATFFCMGIWLAVELYSRLADWFDAIRTRTVLVSRNGKKCGMRMGTVDIFVAAYGICVLLSAIRSPFDMAWRGYDDWYMGAVSQLMFVGIYFLVSRYYSYDRLPLYAGEAALFGVILVGFMNRLGFDPLGVFKGLAENDWVYSHMLSTVGNINWFCGYCSVALAFPLSGYLYARKKGKTVILYLISVAGLTLLFIQGSDSGPVLAMVAIGCCLLAGVRRTEWFRKGLLLSGGMLLCVWLMGRLIEWRGAWAATPVDGWIYDRFLWNGWLWLAMVAWSLSVGSGFLFRKMKERSVKRLIAIGLAVTVLVAATVLGLVLLPWIGNASAGWGSGRGALWRLAWEGFLQADLGGKLLGAGPDCYAEYLISIGKAPVITDEGYWANAIFANAHNEWLNSLVNIGILGVGCYAGLFVAALRRYRGMLLAVLLLALYGVHSLVSFQQVLNAPLFFAVLGICEATYRRKMGLKDLTEG